VAKLGLMLEEKATPLGAAEMKQEEESEQGVPEQGAGWQLGQGKMRICQAKFATWTSRQHP
jgi:hypothetical protein